MWSTWKTTLNHRDRSDEVWSMMKTKLDNDVTNRIGVVHSKTKTKLSRPI